ncbi:MAG: 30S ribosomal protein S10 [Nanoarchaeota archaeon]
MPKTRIKLATNVIDDLNEITKSILDIADKTKTKIYGPIPMPTRRLKLTTRKSPGGRGKASWDRLEMRVHKRLIDLDANERALRLIMRVPIPESIMISIEVVE